MSFVKSKIKRFNEIPSCAPPPGTYDPRSPKPKTIKGPKINAAERFKQPTGLQSATKSKKINSTFKIPSNFSSQSSIFSECSKKSNKTYGLTTTSTSSIKNKNKHINQTKKIDTELAKTLKDIDILDTEAKNATDTCKDYINTCRGACAEALENQVCRVVIKNSQAALFAVCLRLRESCKHNEMLRNESARLQEKIDEIKSFEEIAAEQIAIVEQKLTRKVNEYMNIAESVKNNWLEKIRFIITYLDELETKVDGEVKLLIQKLKDDIQSENDNRQELNYKDLLKKYEVVIKKNNELEEEVKRKEDLERKIIELTNDKNDLAAKLQINKSKLAVSSKNRLDALATPRRRADVENIPPKNKTYILKSNNLKTTKPVAQSSPLREKNW